MATPHSAGAGPLPADNRERHPANRERYHSMSEILQLTNISKTFPGVVALQNISFDLNAARCIAYAARMAPANRP